MKYDTTNSITIVNERSTELHFLLEPWGSSAPMQPGETFVIVFGSALQGRFDVRIEENSIRFYAESLSAQVFKDGKDLDL